MSRCKLWRGVVVVALACGSCGHVAYAADHTDEEIAGGPGQQGNSDVAYSGLNEILLGYTDSNQQFMLVGVQLVPPGPAAPVFTLPANTSFFGRTGISANSEGDALITRATIHNTTGQVSASGTFRGRQGEALYVDIQQVFDIPGLITSSVDASSSPSTENFNVVSTHFDISTFEFVAINRTFRINSESMSLETVNDFELARFVSFLPFAALTATGPVSSTVVYQPDGGGATTLVYIDNATGNILGAPVNLGVLGPVTHLAANDHTVGVMTNAFGPGDTRLLTLSADPSDPPGVINTNLGDHDLAAVSPLPNAPGEQDLYLITTADTNPDPTGHRNVYSQTYTNTGRYVTGRARVSQDDFQITSPQSAGALDGRATAVWNAFDDVNFINGLDVHGEEENMHVPTLGENAVFIVRADPMAKPEINDPADYFDNFNLESDDPNVEVVFDIMPDNPLDFGLRLTTDTMATVTFTIPGLTESELEQVDTGHNVVIAFEYLFDDLAIPVDAKLDITFTDIEAQEEIYNTTIPATDLEAYTRGHTVVQTSPTTFYAVDGNIAISISLLANGDPSVWIDNLAIWIEPIPEPASAALLIPGAMLLGCHRRG